MPRSNTPPLVKTSKLRDPFIVSGDRAYLIGAQDGGFPDMGWHLEGEMGGLWAHPIKLLDGFWLRVEDHWLRQANRFISGPFWNAHEYQLPEDLVVTRRQFVPDAEPAVVLRYTFRSSAARRLALRFLARSDLQLVWPGEKDGYTRERDRAIWLPELSAWLCHVERKPWHLLIGSRVSEAAISECGPDLWGPEQTRGAGISVALDYLLEVPAGSEASLEIVIAGSDAGMDPARTSFLRVRDAAESLWQMKAGRYQTLLAQSTLEAPEHSLVRSWDWLKCNYDWLVRDVPGVGRALGAGVADYPWWFGCDNAYALLGALALGQHRTAIDTLDLLRELSLAANGPGGRVIHEANTRGHTTHPGCTQETPHFVSTVWETFRWTGDMPFLRRNYEFCRRGLLDWTLEAQCRDGDLLPYGYGITEVEGLDLQCIDTAVHTATALTALGGMAEVLHDEPVLERCRALRVDLASRLQDAFWLEEEGHYGDMLATPAQMAPRLRKWLASREVNGNSPAAAALRRLLRLAESDPEPDRKRPWPLQHWIIISPLEAGLADPGRAMRTLDRVEGPEFTCPVGMYLSGIDRTQSMSINTGVLAVAEMRYRRVEQALGYVRALTDTLEMHMPGAISELSPDGGCFLQAWSGYAVVWPVVAHLFGLQPDAHRKHLTVNPTFPASWPEACLSQVRIGGATFDFAWNGRRLNVTVSEPAWTVTSSAAPIEVDIR